MKLAIICVFKQLQFRFVYCLIKKSKKKVNNIKMLTSLNFFFSTSSYNCHSNSFSVPLCCFLYSLLHRRDLEIDFRIASLWLM